MRNFFRLLYVALFRLQHLGPLRCSLLSAFVACACGCHSAKPVEEPKKAAAAESIKVEVVPVSLSSWPTIVRCQGSLVADDQTILGSRVAGLVSETLVDVGDRVEPGQTLVALDDSEFKLQLAAAEAGLLQARALIGLKPGDPVSKLDPLNAPPVRETRATLEETRGRRERWQTLRSQNAVTEEELQALVAAEKVAEARYASALNGVNSNIAQVAVRSAEVDLAKQRLKDASILAPFAGAIQQRFVAAGTFVQIGSPLVTLVRLDSLRFRGTIPERLAGDLEVGQSVLLTIETRTSPLEAKITRINPSLDMASRSLTFEALIDNSDGELRAGLFAEAEVVVNPEAKALVINQSSLLEYAGSQKIWKVVDGMAKEQIVRPGRRNDKFIEIVEGLSPGDVILVNGTMGRAAKVEPTDNIAANAPKSAPSDNDPTPNALMKPNSIPAAATADATVPPPDTKADDKAEPAPSQNAG